MVAFHVWVKKFVTVGKEERGNRTVRKTSRCGRGEEVAFVFLLEAVLKVHQEPFRCGASILEVDSLQNPIDIDQVSSWHV